MRKLVKKTLNLPESAANEYLYGSTQAGCCAIPMTADDSDTFLVDTAFKLLSSRDPATADLARNHLSHTISRRIQRTPSSTEVNEYLSGGMEGDLETSPNELRNTWTLARQASRRLGIRWEIFPDNATIHIDDASISSFNKSKVVHTIREKRRGLKAQTRIAKRSQRKAMECVAASRSSSHFLFSGEYTQFADWRFIHRARLNLLPLNGSKPWRTGQNTSCRTCV
ncbi:uncharacterized protein LOC129232113 [Uloborus diversus]|uniref:uncharacterized protein LOC129232113 n=1 Tax=Uloborus diversus TaxID=327109 RepID=UPI00240A9BA9|nr:uncharacterized protein LOC129232113 [Uloborus diversus]